MTAGYRLAGGLVDRSKPLRFTFDGKAMNGFAGDTLASALIANGVRLVGRSFKYHRPRGILSAGPEEPNALVELRDRRAPRAEHARHHGRALRRACGAEPEPLAVAALRPDGGQPARWRRSRRRLLLQDLHVAGGVLGEALRAADPPRRRPRPAAAASRSRHATRRRSRIATCWWSAPGPAGLTAALAAGRAGARVILARKTSVLGGRLLSERLRDRRHGRRRMGRAGAAELARMPNVRIMPRDHGVRRL